MTRKQLLTAALVACAGVTSATADTLYLSNGTSVSGSVVKNPDGIYVLSVGGNQIMYRADEITKLEKNSATGLEYKEQSSEVVAAREHELVQTTGLSEEDRVYVDRQIRSLRAADTSARAQVVADLTEFGRKVDIVRFLETTLPAMTPTTYPYVLEVFCALAPRAKAEAVLTSSATHLAVPIRRQALRLMGTVGSDKNVELLLRGLVDPSDDVQLAAVAALGELKAKRATPALIDYMERGRAVMQSAARQSLSKIWDQNTDLPANSDTATWQQFWAEHKSLVGAPLDLQGLRPLVDPKAQFVEG